MLILSLIFINNIMRLLIIIGLFPGRFYCDYCDTYLTHDSVSTKFSASILSRIKSIKIKEVTSAKSSSCGYSGVPSCFPHPR